MHNFDTKWYKETIEETQVWDILQFSMRLAVFWYVCNWILFKLEKNRYFFLEIQDFCQLTLNARLNLDILRSTFAKSTKNSSTWKFKENSHEKLKKFYWNKKKKLENMNNVWNFSKDNKTQWNFTKTNNKNHPNFPPALEISLQSFKPSKVWHNFSISP